MGIEIQTKEVKLSDGAQTFTFSGDVGAFVYGLGGFDVWYSDGKDHHLQTFKINLTPNQPSANTIHLTPTVQFTDASGKHASSDSYITMSVAAWIGDDADRNVSMNNADGLGSASFNMGTTASFAQALLSGFDLSFGSSDHHVQSITASTGVQTTGSTATLVGSASMKDNDGNEASTASANAGYAAALKSDPGFGFAIAKVDGYGDQTATFNFSQDVDEVAVFLLSLDFSYGSGKDHHIYKVGAGRYGSDTLTIDGKKATSEVGLRFEDKSGNEAKTHTINMAAIGRYKS